MTEKKTDSSGHTIEMPQIPTKQPSSNDPLSPEPCFPIKPGYKTTEFYKSLAIEIIGVLTAFGAISPVEAELLHELPNAVIAGIDSFVRISGLLTAIFSQWNYTKSRTTIKSCQ